MTGSQQRFSRSFLYLSVMGLFAIFSSTMSKSPTLTLFAISLGASDPEIGLIAAASTIPGILASLPFGIFSDIYGRRKIILLSAFLFASAPFLYLLVTTPFQLGLVRFFHGFATAIFGPVSVAFVADLFPSRKGAGMSIFSSATLLGRFMAPFVGGFLLVATDQSFPTVYIVCGISAVLALVAATRIHPEKTGTLKVEHRSVRVAFVEGFREVVKDRRILVVSGVEAGQLFAFGAVEAFIPKYAKVVIDLSDWQIGAVLGLMVVLLMATKPLMGIFSDRVGKKLPIIIGLIVGATSLISMFLTDSFVSLVVLLMVFGTGMAMVTASTSPMVADLCKEKSYGSALGILDTIMDIGQTLGPIAMGLLIPVLFYYMSFALLGIMLLLLTAFFIVAVR